MKLHSKLMSNGFFYHILFTKSITNATTGKYINLSREFSIHRPYPYKNGF